MEKLNVRRPSFSKAVEVVEWSEEVMEVGGGGPVLYIETGLAQALVSPSAGATFYRRQEGEVSRAGVVKADMRWWLGCVERR